MWKPPYGHCSKLARHALGIGSPLGDLATCQQHLKTLQGPDTKINPSYPLQQKHGIHM